VKNGKLKVKFPEKRIGPNKFYVVGKIVQRIQRILLIMFAQIILQKESQQKITQYLTYS